MIQLLTKKRFRFKNPNVSMIKNETVGVGDDKKVVQTQDGGATFEQTYFEVPPDHLTACPDWVKADPIFGWGVKEGSIIEVLTKSETLAEAERQQGEKARSEEDEKQREAEEKRKADLANMKKIDLLKYASDTHELELSPALTKDAILSAITEAEKEKSSQEGA